MTFWLTRHMITSINRQERKKPPLKTVSVDRLGSARRIQSSGLKSLSGVTCLSHFLWVSDPLTLFSKNLLKTSRRIATFHPFSLFSLRTVPIPSRHSGLQIVTLANHIEGAGLKPVWSVTLGYQSMECCHNSQQSFVLLSSEKHHPEIWSACHKRDIHFINNTFFLDLLCTISTVTFANNIKHIQAEYELLLDLSSTSTVRDCCSWQWDSRLRLDSIHANEIVHKQTQ